MYKLLSDSLMTNWVGLVRVKMNMIWGPKKFPAFFGSLQVWFPNAISGTKNTMWLTFHQTYTFVPAERGLPPIPPPAFICAYISVLLLSFVGQMAHPAVAIFISPIRIPKWHKRMLDLRHKWGSTHMNIWINLLMNTKEKLKGKRKSWKNWVLKILWPDYLTEISSTKPCKVLKRHHFRSWVWRLLT